MEYTVLVNKTRGLEKDYVPQNLIEAKSKYKAGIKIDNVVYKQWIALQHAVADKGYFIELESGYRSYDYQDKLLKELIAEKGSEYAHKAIALPGHSEHQTGFAIDYCVLRDHQFIVEYGMEECEECTYTNSIAHHYGFIVRYPKDKEHITGYKYEPWHIRYIGEDLATYLYENKLTLDEYYKAK